MTGGQQHVAVRQARVVLHDSTAGLGGVSEIHPISYGQSVEVGRESQLLLAADPPDRLVSRCAVRVLAAPEGWWVECLNRNGVVVHPWGQPSWRATAKELLPFSRVALRVLGREESRHWVLLEDDNRLAGAAQPLASATAGTDLGIFVRELTAAQREVLNCLFADLVAWPPRIPSQPLLLKQVARTLDISVSAVQARLQEVRAKARSLGLTREVPLTDPEYLYALVRAGYLEQERDG